MRIRPASAVFVLLAGVLAPAACQYITASGAACADDAPCPQGLVCDPTGHCALSAGGNDSDAGDVDAGEGDAGGSSDGGVSTDAGTFSDAGHPGDAGHIADAGDMIDAGHTPDAGHGADAGNSPDAGPACLQPSGMCTDGNSCNESTGGCETDCRVAGLVCPAGQSCDAAQGYCYVVQSADCRTAGSCPAGQTCNTTSGACAPTVVNYYETCGTRIADCASGMDCVTFPSMGSICILDCSGGETCPTSPAGSTCSLSVTGPSSSNLMYCVIPCSSTGGSTCPTHTSCQNLGDDTYDCSP